MPFKLGSINSKLFFIILVFVCIPLLVLGLFWYEKTTAAIEDNAVKYSQHLLKQTNEYLDFYLIELEQATVPFLSQPQVQSYLKLDPDNSTRYERFITSQKIQDESFASILEGRSDIFGISLINDHGMQVNNYVKVNNYLDMNEIKKRNIHLWNIQKELDPYQIMDIEFVQGTPVLTVVRKVFDKHTYDTSGLLIINLRLNKLKSIINEVTLSHFKNVWIVNENDKIVYHPDHSELSKTFSYEQTENHDKDYFFINRDDSLKTLKVYDHSSTSNWTMAASVPLGKLMTNLITVRNSTIWIGLLLIGVALVFVGGFSFFLTYSLSNLQKMMKQVESGNLNIERKKPNTLSRNDEVNDLYDSFYTMTHKLNHLIKEVQHSKLVEKELELKNRESELHAMQSQINPHFLYNTLEIINSHAIIENQMMISRMTTSLADMFRYNVSNTKTIVTLKEEIQQIRSYLQIQKERFEELQVYFDIDDTIAKEVWTARLTIQPIIENAFVHGYEDHELTPTFIGVYGKVEEHHYTLSIVDRGHGMNKGTKDGFNHAFLNNEDPPVNRKTTKRIGLINVHKRIYGSFGHPYGLYIKQSDENGTIVEIKLPYDQEEKKKEA
ncbi:sensor histidine kinase [Alkalihalobacillus sp. TS-13]|uniref:sensor histidine kinase n=1 Tax=Alkalihalobacillus sp. TS-13 TaxID=2842455 RepID=UPI001C867E9B|nr:sensor histidine kinase [Alkalihalobacillus sp. TS-13]